MYPNPYFSSTSLGETTTGSGVLTDQDSSGGNNNLNPIPNLNQISGVHGRIRCTGMAARVTYEGTELTRAGRFVAGHPNVVNFPTSRGSAVGTAQYSAVSTWSKNATATTPLGDLQQVLRNVTTARIADGVFEAHWLPSGIPQYMSVFEGGPSLLISAQTQGYHPLNQGPGLIGQESGQSALVILIDGDVTSVAATIGNPYSIELIWHWEYIPENLYTTVLPLSPSPFLPMELAAVLNRIQQVPSASMPPTASMQPRQMQVVQAQSSFNRGMLKEAAKIGAKLVEGYIQQRSAGRRPRAQRSQRAITHA